MNFDNLERLIESLGEFGYSAEITEAYENPIRIKIYFQKEEFDLVVKGNKLLFPRKLKVGPINFQRRRPWFYFPNIDERMDQALAKLESFKARKS